MTGTSGRELLAIAVTLPLPAVAASCENLVSLPLSRANITLAEAVTGGLDFQRTGVGLQNAQFR
jgi:hypothetical protein